MYYFNPKTKYKLKSALLPLMVSVVFLFCGASLSFADTDTEGRSSQKLSTQESTSEELSGEQSEKNLQQDESVVEAADNSSESPPVQPLGPTDDTTESVSLFWNASSIEINPSTGSANLSIPIMAPPGRGGIQPNLTLSYSSGGQNGMFGVGWSLELGSIMRSTKYGVPTYDDEQDTFVLFQQGSSQELVDIGDDLYRPEIEGAFLRIEYNGTYWVATDKKGTKYFFGQTSASRQTDGSRNLKWALDKVIDIHGNFMEITYHAGLNQIYPEHISYTDHDDASMSAFADIEFVRETRPDMVESWRSNMKVVTDERINQILVTAGEALQRKYVLTYSQSPDTGASLITNIALFDNADNSLPSTSLLYSTAPWNDLQNLGTWSQGDIKTTGDEDFLRQGDFNGDGLMDLILADSSSWNWNIFLSTGTSFVNAGSWEHDFVDSNGEDTDIFEVADFNGDGLSDVIHINNSAGTPDGNWPWTIYLSTGSSFIKGVWRHDYVDFSGDDADFLRIGDFNGDGKSDVVHVENSIPRWYGLISTGSGFSQYTFRNEYVDPSGGDRDFFEIGDFNADGKSDIIHVENSSSQWRVYFSNGTSITSQGVWKSVYVDPTDEDRDAFRLADFNGDGLTDIIHVENSSKNWYVYFSCGDGFESRGAWVGNSYVDPTGDDMDQFIVSDFNGDKLNDIIHIENSSTNWRFYLSDGTSLIYKGVWHSQYVDPSGEDRDILMIGGYEGEAAPQIMVIDDGNDQWRIYQPTDQVTTNLLTQTNNNIGKSTAVTYISSSAFPHEGYFPFNIDIVKEVNVTEQITEQTYTTEYEYENGLWNIPKREFRGFGRVKIMDADNNYSVSEFEQDDDHKKGRVLRQSTYDAQSPTYPMAETINHWQKSQVGTDESYFVFLDKKDVCTYEGDPSKRCTREEYQYDQYGNVTNVIQYGEYDVDGSEDIGTDSRHVTTEYVHNDQDGNWLIGFPKQVQTFDHDGTPMRQAWFYYDNNPGLNDPPVKGLLTKKVNWDPEGDDPETEYTYDTYGNVLTTTDPKDNVTTIEYDTDFKMFPVLTTNALGHEVKSEYYGVEGVPLSGGGYSGLWGQLKSGTDPNDQIVQKSYDTFGRNVLGVSPLDTIEFPTTTTEYVYAADHYKVKAYQRMKHGEPGTIDAVSYYDGLGRLIQTKTRSGTENQYIVSGQVEYNSLGKPLYQYLPRFTTNDLDTMDPIDPQKPRTTMSYDAVGRVVQVDNPDGTYANTIYDDWSVASIDANGHQQVSYFDAYGRLIKKEEYTGADGRCSYYPQEAFTLYAATHYKYDSQGNLIETKDTHDNITTIVYDKLGRKKTMTDPDMGYWQYGYDLNGNLTWQIDAKGQRIDFEYDKLNRLVNKTGDGESDLDVVYTYDDPLYFYTKGRLTQVEYQASGQTDKTDFEYDEIGREIRSTKQIGQSDYNVIRNYDALNNLKNVEYPGAEKVYYHYNDAGQIESVSEAETPPGDQSKASPWTMDDGPWSSVIQLCSSVFDNFIEPYVLGVGTAHADADSEGKESVSPTELTDLVGYWKLNEEEGASTASDTSGRGNHGEIIGATAGHPGKMAGAFHFDGTDDYIRVDDSSSLNMTSRITLSALIRLESVEGNWRIMQKGQTDDQYRLLQENDVLKFDLEGVGTLATSQIPALREWHHVVATYDGTYMRIYIDGAEAVSKSASGSIAVSDAPLCIGSKKPGSPEQDYFQGLMDEVKIWKRGLSVGEVENLFSIYQSQLPDAPVLNDPVLGEEKIDLSWSQVSGTAGYKVKYGTEPGVYPDIVDVGDTLEYSVTGLPADETYYFVVSSYDGISESENSNEKSITIDPLTPPNLTGIEEIDGDVKLDWEGTPEALGYKVKYGTTSGVYPHVIDVGDVETCTVEGLEEGQTYYFVVSAMYLYGESDNSNELSIEISIGDGDGLKAKYYNGMNFETLVTTQIDSTVDFEWGPDSPAPGVDNDHFSVRWYGQVRSEYTEDYTFYTVTDDGVRLWVNDQLIIDKWVDQSPTEWSGNISLEAGQKYNIRMDFYENTVDATAQLFWSSSSQEKQVIPQINLYSSTGQAGLQAPVLNDPVLGEERIDLSWSLVIDATGYKVKYGTESGVYPNVVDVGDTLAYSVTGLPADATYYFVVLAYDEEEESDHSNEKSITIGPLTPPNLTRIQEINGDVQLVWEETPEALGYKVKYGTTSGVYPNVIDVGDVWTYTVEGLEGGQTYYFVVSAVYLYGESDNSNELSIYLEETEPQVFVKDVQYNASGQVMRIEYGNGVVTTYEYNPLNLRLMRIYSIDSSEQVLQDLNYQYDAVGNIVAIDDFVESATQSFEYDALNRLTKATNNQTYGVKNYVYDEVGNLLEKDGVTYTYGEGGAGPHAVSSLSDGTTFQYDDNGNMTAKLDGAETTEYFYDVENRLKEVKKNGEIAAEFEYDGDGGRTKKVYYPSPESPVTSIYIGSLFENADGQEKKYVYLGSKRVAAVNGADTSFYLEDHLGGVNLIVDEEESVNEVIEYQPYGAFARHDFYGGAQAVADFYFTGQRLDEGTGLYYYNARYYDPSLGRFITADTIVPHPTNPQALNRYSYAGNNPISHLEDGHGWGKWWKKAWENFTWAVRHPFDIKGQWERLVGEANQPGMAPITSAVITVASFMFMQPELMFTTSMWTSTAASAGSAAFLESPAGQDLVDWTAQNIYDNILGMRPSTARVWASIDLGMTSSYMIERTIANIIADPVQTRSLTNDELKKLSSDGYFAGDEGAFGPSLRSKNAPFDEIKGLTKNDKLVGSFQKRTLNVPGLKQLGAQHSSANALAVSGPRLNPFRYATWGTCHQATNMTLLQGGISSTIMTLGPSWDMFVTTAVYGNYGGQLGYRIYTGVNSNDGRK